MRGWKFAARAVFALVSGFLAITTGERVPNLWVGLPHLGMLHTRQLQVVHRCDSKQLTLLV